MVEKVTFYCDGCGIEKKLTNHWFRVRVDNSGWTIAPFDHGAGSLIYCGQDCVVKALTEYMAGLRG